MKTKLFEYIKDVRIMGPWPCPIMVLMIRMTTQSLGLSCVLRYVTQNPRNAKKKFD